MSVLSTLLHRRSIRSYNPDHKLSKDQLIRIAQAGWLAPSACNKQDWLFYIIDTPDLIDKISQSMKQDFGKDASAFIVTVGRSDAFTLQCNLPAEAVDLSIATTCMILAAHEAGIDSCWIGAFDPDMVADILDLESPFVPVTLITLGKSSDQGKGAPSNLSEVPLYTDEDLPSYKKRKPFDEVIRFFENE